VAKLGDVALLRREDGLVAGGAFLLGRENRLSAVVALPNSAEVEISSLAPYVIARLPATSRECLIRDAHQAAQAGLDWLSVTGRADLWAKDTEETNLVWWEADGTPIIQARTIFNLRASVGQARLTLVGDASAADDGPVAANSEHPGFRYYRLSQVTDDLYNAYRNMYLAFELTLSRGVPPNKGEREIHWLRRALSQAEGQLQLAGILKVPTDKVPDTLIEGIYRDARLPLFHAKFNRDYYSPHDDEGDRGVVANALKLLSRVVLRMFQRWHDARRLGGFVSPHWLYESAFQLWSKARVVVSDHTDMDLSECDFEGERFRTAVTMATPEIRRAANNSPQLVASISTEQLRDLPHVQRFELVGDESPMMAHVLECELDVGGFDECQFLAGIHVVNAGLPRRQFSE